jgi:hypothetical protein
VTPAPRDGVEVAEFDPPEAFATKRLSEFLHLVHVDISEKRLIVRKPSI